MIAILSENDSKVVLFQSFPISFVFIHPLPNLRPMQISNTNLYLFFCSDECQIPEYFWMVKFLGHLNSLKLRGALLSWDSFRHHAIYIVDFQLSRCLAIMVQSFYLQCAITFLRHFTHCNSLQLIYIFHNLDLHSQLIWKQNLRWIIIHPFFKALMVDKLLEICLKYVNFTHMGRLSNNKK